METNKKIFYNIEDIEKNFSKRKKKLNKYFSTKEQIYNMKNNKQTSL